MKPTKYHPAIICFLLAIAIVSSAPSFGAGNSTSLYREGAKLARAGEIESAITKFKESIKRNPYYSMGHYGLGKAYLYSPGKIKDAIRHLERAVRLDTKNAKGYFYLGVAYLLNKKMVPAIHAFDEAFRRDATLIESMYNIGAAYDMMGYDSKAYLYFELFLQKKERTDRDILF